MKITYNKNPLYTTIELNDHEKEVFKYKIKIEQLEDMVHTGNFYLQSNEYFNIEEAKMHLNIKYDDNDISDLDKNCDAMFNYYLGDLTFGHYGDCVCQATSCSKCHAESLLGIDTLKGLDKHSANKIVQAFGNKNEKTIDEALEYLKNYDAIPTTNLEQWVKIGGYEQYMPRWKDEAKSAYDWLLSYKIEHL